MGENPSGEGHSRRLQEAHARRAGFDRPEEYLRKVDRDGYVHVREAPGRPWRREHRVVMERLLGRPLRAGELVRHRNDDRGDNRPENLELWLRAPGAGIRAADLVCPHCGRRYHRPLAAE